MEGNTVFLYAKGGDSEAKSNFNIWGINYLLEKHFVIVGKKLDYCGLFIKNQRR